MPYTPTMLKVSSAFENLHDIYYNYSVNNLGISQEEFNILITEKFRTPRDITITFLNGNNSGDYLAIDNTFGGQIRPDQCYQICDLVTNRDNGLSLDYTITLKNQISIKDIFVSSSGPSDVYFQIIIH